MTDPGKSVLAGKRIVVTRAAAQAIDLLKALQHAGAIPILLPVIQILPPEDFAPTSTSSVAPSPLLFVCFPARFQPSSRCISPSRFPPSLNDARA